MTSSAHRADPSLLEIALASPEEAFVVQAITRAAFTATSRFATPSSALGETLATVRQHIEGGEVLLLRQRGRPIAACRFSLQPPVLTFSRLAVLPAEGRRGVGSHFLRSLEARARANGCLIVRCSARSSMPDNRPFYLARGYAVVGYETAHGVPRLKTLLEKKLDLGTLPSEGDATGDEGATTTNTAPPIGNR